MSQLVLEIPDTLRQKLEELARNEGVSLSQYLIFALTCQAVTAYTVKAVSEEEIDQQKSDFAHLLRTLGQANLEEIEQVMQDRKVVRPQKGLTPQVVRHLQNKTQLRKTD